MCVQRGEVRDSTAIVRGMHGPRSGFRGRADRSRQTVVCAHSGTVDGDRFLWCACHNGGEGAYIKRAEFEKRLDGLSKRHDHLERARREEERLVLAAK